MRFLCLICAEKMMEQMTDADAERHFDEYARFTADVRGSGHFVDCNRLQPPAAATTVRVRNDKVSTTDGPFAETKEQLGGYYMLEASDLNEAIQIAARIPGARMGCVEVRPVAEDTQTLRALGMERPPMTGREQRQRWWALYVLCAGVLMIVLDTTIVNVALPSIREDLALHRDVARLGRQRLHADVRRVPAARRPARRPVRPPPAVPARHHAVHARVARVRRSRARSRC